MLEGINIVCFSASYAVALALEISRLFGRSRAQGVALVLFALAGFFAHTVYLTMRAVSAEALPLSTAYDWSLLAAWLLAATYLYLAATNRQSPIGLFVLPLVLALIGAATVASQEPLAVDRASELWGNAHGVALLLGAVAVLVGFASGVMYLVQSYRLKHKLPPAPRFRLPSLESLERTSSRALHLSTGLLAVGFLSGVVLNAVRQQQSLTRMSWTDPVIVSSASMLVWLLAATIFSLVYPPSRQGRKVAYLTLANFLFLAIVIGTLVWSGDRHANADRAMPAQKSLSAPSVPPSDKEGAP